MTTYATNNALGSTDPRDLYDNSQNFDFALNDITQAIWKDRFGRDRHSWYGLESMVSEAASSFGYITLVGVSFNTGATVHLNEVLLNPADNGYYKWTGSFPDGGKMSLLIVLLIQLEDRALANGLMSEIQRSGATLLQAGKPLSLVITPKRCKLLSRAMTLISVVS